MTVQPLPERPNLDQLRRQAKELRKAGRDGEAEALARIAAYHPAGMPVSLAAERRYHRFADVRSVSDADKFPSRTHRTRSVQCAKRCAWGIDSYANQRRNEKVAGFLAIPAPASLTKRSALLGPVGQ